MPTPKSPIEDLLDLHDRTCARCREIMRAKNADYTVGSGDPFANFRIAGVFGVHPVLGIILRMSDKMQRIRSFVAAGTLEVKEETVEDACDDLVNYAILIKGMLLEGRNAATHAPGADEPPLK